MQNNPFVIGDLVLCARNISEEYGGPLRGQTFIVTITSDSHIGFKLPYYNMSSNSSTTNMVREGKYANWHYTLFSLIKRTDVSKILYGN